MQKVVDKDLMAEAEARHNLIASPYGNLPMPNADPKSPAAADEILEIVLRTAEKVIAEHGAHPVTGVVFSENDADGNPVNGYSVHVMSCVSDWPGAPLVTPHIAATFEEEMMRFGARSQGFAYALIVHMAACACGKCYRDTTIVVQVGHIARGTGNRLVRKATVDGTKLGPWLDPDAN
jgi:hypothetical protein